MFTLEQLYILPILYYQYHSCPSSLSRRYVVNQISWNISSLDSEELIAKCDGYQKYLSGRVVLDLFQDFLNHIRIFHS